MELICVSHSPLLANDVGSGVREAFEHSFASLAERVAAFDPELILLFASDHFNGFVYKALPQFCIGTSASAIGDYDSAAGTMNVPEGLANDCIAAVLADDIDVGISHNMTIDHGFAQPLDFLIGKDALRRYPTIPIFINCNAPPRPPCRRARLFGSAVGRWATTLEKRILVIASGGLSHDPPIFPRLENAAGPVRDRLINGSANSAEEMSERRARVEAAGRAFARDELPEAQPLNETWDRAFVDLLLTNRIEEVDGFSDQWISAEGGFGGHEIRTWISAAACAAANGKLRGSLGYYAQVREWLTAMAHLAASSGEVGAREAA